MRKHQYGFSLIEVVLAVALLGITIVAVVGLVGAVSRSVTDIDDHTIASRLSNTIQEELRRTALTNFPTLENTPVEGGGAVPLELFANAAGDRVILANDTARLNDPELGIPQRDRYYQIHVTRMGGNLNYQTHSPFVALRVRVRWPYYLPTGPGANDFVPYVQSTDDEARQRIAIYHVAVPRTN